MNSAPEVLVDEINPSSMPETTSGDVGGVEDLEINAPVDAASSGGSGAPAESTGSVTGAAAASGEGITAEDLLPNPIGSPDSAPPMKGYGLKKWRRIRRDSGSDAAVGIDSGMILKRRLSLPEPVKARDDNSKQKNDAADADAEGEGSIASNTQVAATVAIVGTGALDPELELLVASGGFSVGADSDNSEDRSSKSSTAASVPRTRHEMAGYARERSKGKGSGGRGSGHAMQQRSQRGRGGGGMDASKKFRADQLKFYKENSQSSIESDLRSSNVAFVRWGSVVSSNGKQSELSVNDDEEHSDGDQTCEEIKSGYYKENGRARGSSRGDFDADPQDEDNAGERENSRPRTDLDPFLESVVLLQAAQEALETEIQKFEEIDKEPALDNSNGLLNGIEGSNSPALEAQFLELHQNHVESRQEEAPATMKAKEPNGLEAILNRTQMLKKETENHYLPSLKENCKEIELELEDLLKKRIEAEVEYLITATATQNWEVQSDDQIFLLEEQKSLVKEQAQMMLKLRESENRAAMLKEQAEELEGRCIELLGTEEVLKLQNKVCRSSLCCFIQLVMLSITFWCYLMQLLLISDGNVPT